MTELVGWDKFPPSSNRIYDSISVRASAPYYGGYSDYKWVKVGGTDGISAVIGGIGVAYSQFNGGYDGTNWVLDDGGTCDDDTYVPTYGDYWVPGSGGGDDPPTGGNPTPPPPPPPPPPPVDSLCKATGDTIQPGQNGAGLLGPLSSKAVQSSLAALEAESISTSTEIPGYILVDASLNYQVVRGTPIAASTDNCGYGMGGFTVPAGYAVVGYFHTHPLSDGQTQSCRINTQSNGVVTNLLNGGGSNLDWDTANTKMKPVYTINPDAISRLDPGVAATARTSNKNIFNRQAAGCAVKRT